MAINYTKTNWQNGQAPAISATNLNKIEQGIKDSADGVDTLNVDVTALESAVDTLEADVDALEGKLVYTTTEQRVGTWIDGKPLYRRVIASSVTLMQSGWVNICSISGMNIKKLVNAVALDDGSSSTYHWITQGMFRADNGYLSALAITNNITVTHTIITYTKTTD